MIDGTTRLIPLRVVQNVAGMQPRALYSAQPEWAGGVDVRHQLRELVPLLVITVDELGVTHSTEICSEGGPSTIHPRLERGSGLNPLGWYIRGGHHHMHKDVNVVLVCGRNRLHPASRPQYTNINWYMTS